MRALIVLWLFCSVDLSAQKVTSEKLIGQAEYLIVKQQFKEALEPLNECIKKFPAVVDAYGLRGKVKEQLGQPLEALTDLNIAIELDPTSSEILLNRALLAFKLKRFDLAKPDLRKLLTSRDTETNMVYFRRSNNEGVDNIMTVQSPIQDQVYNYLGLIEYELNETSESVLYFDSAIAINPKQPDYFAHRALVKLKAGDTELASQDLYLALELDPDHAVSKNILASIRHKEGKLADAEKLLFEATLTNTRAHQHHSSLAMLQLGAGQFAEAILNLDTAILIEPKDGELFIARGSAKEKLNDLEGAKRDYSIAIQIDDQWPKAWFVQGNIYLKQNQLTEALENYTIAILLDENYTLAYHNRAITNMKLGDTKNACADLIMAEKGMSVDPKMKSKICGQ